MLKRMFRHICRQPVPALAVVLFAGILAAVLCHMEMSALQEQQSFEDTYASVPVTFRVADLDGSKPGTVKGWIADLFTDRGVTPNLAPFVGQLHQRVSYGGTASYTYQNEAGEEQHYECYKTVTGISSLYVAQELTEDWGGQILWREGYDEGMFAAGDEVCLVPESMADCKMLMVSFTYYKTLSNGTTVEKNSEKQLQVAGYYTDRGNDKIYCAYEIMRQVHGELGVSKSVEEVCAVLNDNSQLDALREAAGTWFAEPNASGEPTYWGKYGYQNYFYALDIDDLMLKNLESGMKSSMRLNRIASLVIFALSAGAGFLVGFLVIRSRKREITLMRTMGSSGPSIFTEFALEQLVCVTAGLLIGGAQTLWQPADRLAMFGGVYFLGLTVALIIFLRKNLLSIIKEDE